MKNLDRHTWDWSRGEKYAIRWLEENGYDVTVNSRHVSADHFTVAKAGITTRFRLPLGDPKINYRNIMEQFERDFILLTRIRERESST